MDAPRIPLSRRAVVASAAWSVPAVALALAAPAAAASSVDACPDTSAWFLKYVNGGYTLDPDGYAALVEWSTETGVPLPTTVTFTAGYVDIGYFWTEKPMPGYTPDQWGYIRIPVDASVAPTSSALPFSGGVLLGSKEMLEATWADRDAKRAARVQTLPGGIWTYNAATWAVLPAGTWTYQGENVYQTALADFTFGNCTASIDQIP